MRIAFSPQSQMSSANFRYHSNRNVAKNAIVNNSQAEKNHAVKKDSIFRSNMDIGLGGKPKKNNMLKNLMEQKTNLIDSKNEFMEKALKNGEDPRSIKKQLEGIDKQIEEIDKQINKIQLEEQRKAVGNEDKKKKLKSSKQKSNDISENDMKKKQVMESIVSLSGNLKKTKALSSQRNKMMGEARVLESEIKIDEGRRINPLQKKKQLAEIKVNVAKIGEKLGEQLKDSNNKIKNNIKIKSENNSISRNETNKDESKKIENSVGNLINKQQALQKIKQYKENNNYKSKYNEDKLNIIA
jgi:hypothetical protein